MDDVETLASCRVPYPSAQPIYAASERWRDEALIGDRSLFDGRPIDGAACGRELVEHFVNNADEGSGTFVDKLGAQLSTVSADAVRVAAELLYVHFLIASTSAVSSKTKLATVGSVLAFRESGASDVPKDLADALQGGIASPGQAFNNYRWKMFAFLINFFVEVKSISVDERRAVLTDRASVQDIFDRLEQQTVWSQMWAVEHLLFPDLAPSMLSRGDRDDVVKTWPELGSDVSQILRRLEPNVEYGDRRAVLPYRTPYREQWQGTDPALDTYAQWAIRILDSPPAYQDEINYKLDIAASVHDAITSAERGESPFEAVRSAFQHRDFNLVDYRVFNPFLGWMEDEPREAIAALREFGRYQGGEAIDRFLGHLPRTGQLSGLGARLSLASVFLMATDPYFYPPYRITPARATARLTKGYSAQESATEGEHYQMSLERMDRIMATMAKVERPLEHRLGAQSLAWLIAQWQDPPWDAESYRAFDAWRTGKEVPVPPRQEEPAAAAYSEEPAGDQTEPWAPHSMEDLGERLYFAEGDLDWLEESVALLHEKRQLILQGPPGTGKTYIARELAKFVAGSPDRVRVVQFHPSYSYEDFVNGLRPDPDQPSHFRLVPGPLVQLAERARTNPSEQHVLLIDEINRANVPAVFGELYYLLEYRDDAIIMTYGGEPFSLPTNLLVIGTMNTADRSITTLDSAMRRRFYVRDLRPGEAPLDGILRNFIESRDPGLLWLVELLDHVNKDVGDRELAIGPSHFMSDPPTEEAARRAWDNSVLPTLRDTFYSRPSVLQGMEFSTLKERVTGVVTDDAAD